MLNGLQKPKRTITTLVLICFLFTQVASGVFLYAKPARAQWVVTDPITGAQTTIKNVWDYGKIFIVNAGLMALTNAATWFTQKLAYDAAVAIASGGKGQMPLFSTKGWGKYLGDVGMSAAGEFIGDFSKKFGVDFCAPPNPEIQLAIQIGLAERMTPPPPKCDFAQIMKNWDAFAGEFKSGEVLKRMQVAFKPGQSDLSLALDISGRMFDKIEKETLYKTKEREEGKGFMSLESMISGQVKTPAEAIRQTYQTAVVEGPLESEDIPVGLTSQGLAQGALSLLNIALTTFLNTLAAKTLQNLLKKGIYSFADLLPKEGFDQPELAGRGGQRAAELAFTDLLTPRIKEGGAYDILSEFVSCPDKFRNLNNCVIDGMFEAAIRQAQTGAPLTVREAIEKGYLHGDWPLIPESDQSKNQDPYCFQKGYCYSNLVKLRKARIIPIGWEIAANSPANTGTVTLKQIVDNFHNCNNEGAADADHPWCHLIDPDWLLKYPLHQCRAKVYGPLLQTSESNIRQETCVDTPSCIAEDENYNCEGGWGYCVREKNVWRLNADSCDAQYDSCRTFSSRTGQVNSYLLNTVNYDDCDAEQVGCKWYSKWQSKVGTDWQWQDRPQAGTKTDRIYFNKNVSQCDAADEGCTEFLKTTKETSLNLLKNPSFETFTGTVDDGAGDIIESWEIDDQWPNIVSDAYTGSVAIKSEGSITQEIETGPLAGRTFTLSVYGKNGSSAETVSVKANDQEVIELQISDVSEWTRVSETYTFPSNTTASKLTILINLKNQGLIDAVQLEERLEATPYHEGWAGTGESIYLKKAPEYYNCYNYNPDGTVKTSDDADACANFSGACMESEVGCEKYTPVTGDPWVPGIANYPDDYCPAECVGYQTFAQEATNFEPAKFPVYFIPQTAQSCPATEAGCDQFTNLETEAIENYSYLRRCQVPGADEATYYTWEGSDTAGYQLKTWSLKKSNLSGSITDISPDGGIGPCTKLAADGVNCDDDRTTGTCTKADMARNPDCREFYDTEGKRHYRLYSKTIVSTDDCHPYRKTISTEVDCRDSGGKWDAGRAECVYMSYPAESISCSAVGCRAYRGNTGANIMTVFWDDFEAGSTDWTNTGVEISTEALEAGGHSLKVPTTTAKKPVGDLVRKNGIYLISFWAKAGAPGVSAEVKFSSDPGSPLFTNLSLSWQPYTLGPIQMTWDPASDDTNTSNYEGEVLDIATGGLAYFDNIMLREVTDRIYLIKDSWTTPASCDMTIFGGYLPQSMLGCQAYYDRANRIHYLKSFTNLCRPEAIGCEKLIDTKNSVSPFEETYNLQTPNDIEEDTVRVPADSYSFLIVDQTKSCNPANKGCTAFGSPALDAEGAAVGFETVYLKNDPIKYTGQDKILCEAPYLGCEEYTDTRGTKFYFKDPGARTCEWRERVNYQGEDRTGWFRTGTNEPCYPNYEPGGIFGIWKNADLQYARWVGICPSEQNFCTKFIDPSKTSGENPEGEPYYYIKNAKLDALASECRGQVSLKNGCVLFNDTSDLNLIYSSGMTYKTSDRKAGDPGGLVNAIDCRQGECKQCSGLWLFPPGPPFCVDDKDCPTSSTCETPSSPPANDSNLILKVQRDRVCGEWLTCQSSTTTWDSMNNTYKEICDAVGLCNQYQKAGQATACANFVERPAEILDLKTYTSRGVTWNAMDYSGYSLYNKFPIEKLSQINVADKTTTLPEEDDWRLAYIDTKCYDAVGEERSCGTDPPGTCDGANGSSCGGGKGKCWNHLCAYDIEGNVVGSISEAKPLEREDGAPAPLCRAYPESDSPFPQTIGVEKRKPGFARANICEEGGNKCECDYQKVEYKNAGVTKYYSPDQTDIPEGICQGGPYDGQPCIPGGNECEPTKGGTCAMKSRVSTIMGWWGYCLEKDKSRNINGDQDQFACLTWLPVDHLMGSADIYNQYLEAGFASNPPSVYGQYYCLEGSGVAGSDGDYQEKTRVGGVSRASERPLCVQAACEGGGNLICDDESLPTCRGNAQCNNGSLTCGPPVCSDGSSPRCDDNSNPECISSCYDDQDNLTDSQPFCWLGGSMCLSGGFVVSAGGFQFGRDSVAPSAEENFYQYQIEKIIFKVIARDGEDPSRDTEIELWADGTEDWLETTTHNRSPGIVVTGKYLGRDNELILFYGSSANPQASWGYVTNTGKVCYGNSDCESISGNILGGNDGGSFKIKNNIIDGNDAGIWNNKYQAKDICPGGRESDGNWHAIRLRFNKTTGKFEGYDWAYCDESPGSGGIVYEVTFKMKEMCYRIADTAATSNTAWTNRVWQAGSHTISDLGYEYSTPMTPFGSLQINAPSTSQITITEPTVFDCPSSNGESRTGVSDCKVDNQGHRPLPYVYTPGAPYSCPGPGGDDGHCVRSELSGQTVAYTPVDAAGGEDADWAKDRLSEIFARSWGIYKWDAGKKEYQKLENGDYNWNITETGDGGEAPSPPEVAAIGPCRDSKCQPGASGTITVNEKSSGTVISRTGNLKATIKFFAWADENQMPIKSVVVDFDNGVIRNPGEQNFYKNHMGYKSNGNSQCDNTNFGRSTDACVEEPFVFQTTYTCTRNVGPNWNSTCPDPTISGGCCVFVPKVQVKDNWGWCNGSCPGEPGGDGCYDKSWDTPTGVNECETIHPQSAADPMDPWTYFADKVIVVPR